MILQQWLADGVLQAALLAGMALLHLQSRDFRLGSSVWKCPVPFVQLV